MKTVLGILLAIVTALPVTACGDDSEPMLDCASVCSRYDSCVAENYDVGSCVDRCETNEENVTGFTDTYQLCDRCMQQRACTEDDFPCENECASVVP